MQMLKQDAACFYSNAMASEAFSGWSISAEVTRTNDHTVQELCGQLREQGAASVSVITLLDKAARRAVDLTPDYRGFEVRSPTPVPSWSSCMPVRTCMRPACAWSLLLLQKPCCVAWQTLLYRAEALG